MSNKNAYRLHCHSFHEGRCLDNPPCMCKLIEKKGYAAAYAHVAKLEKKEKPLCTSSM